MKADRRIQQIPLNKLILDDTIQSRAAIVEAAVKDYAESMHQGDEFPPLVIFEENDLYHVADGFHRKLAADEAGLDTIPCQIHPGGKEAAFIFSLKANSTHGERRTNADKWRSVERAFGLPGLPQISNEQIARMCAVSSPFVAKVRQALDLNGLDSPTTRINKRGKPVNTKNQGNRRKPPDKQTATPEVTGPEAAPTTGQSEAPFPDSLEPGTAEAPDDSPEAQAEQPAEAQPVTPQLSQDHSPDSQETAPQIEDPDATPIAADDPEAKDSFNWNVMDLAGMLAKQLENVTLSNDLHGWLNQDTVLELTSLNTLISSILTQWNE